MADADAPAELTADQVAQVIRSRFYVALLLISVVIWLLVTLAAWFYLELIYQPQKERASTRTSSSSAST